MYIVVFFCVLFFFFFFFFSSSFLLFLLFVVFCWVFFVVFFLFFFFFFFFFFFWHAVIYFYFSLFVQDHSNAPKKYSDVDVIKMLKYLTNNIFEEFGGRIFQQTIGIPMCTNCASLLADLVLYSYEAFVQSPLKAGKKHLAQQFNFTYKYIDDVLSLKNTKFTEYLEFIFPRELEIK